MLTPDNKLKGYGEIGMAFESVCSPMNYFEGILQPVGVDKHNDVIYEYRDWERQIWQSPLPPLDVELTAKAKRESMVQEITLDELRQLRRIGFENDAD